MPARCPAPCGSSIARSPRRARRLPRQRSREGKGQKIDLLVQPKWLNTWLIEQFASWLDGGPEMETNVAANVHASALVFGGIESARTGQAVKVAEFVRANEP